MAIIFPNSKSLTEVGGKISTPGRIVQTVHTTYSSSMITSSTSPVDFFTSSAITMSNAANILHIEWHSDNRIANWGDGVWNLYFMDLVHVNTGSQIAYSGYRGSITYNIKHYHRSVTHAPGSVGPHSYKLRGWSYSALSTYFNYPTQVGNDGVAYIRISEIAV